MIITQIVVSVHEKRNHPHEYGHADAEVRLTADLGPGDDPDVVIADLQAEARAHVNQELDDWIAGIEERKRIDRLIGTIRESINRLHWHGEKLRWAKNAIRAIGELPEGTRGPWRERLRQRLAEVKAEEQRRAAQQPPPDAPVDEDESRICPDCGADMHPDGICFYCETEPEPEMDDEVSF